MSKLLDSPEVRGVIRTAVLAVLVASGMYFIGKLLSGHRLVHQEDVKFLKSRAFDRQAETPRQGFRQ